MMRYLLFSSLCVLPLQAMVMQTLSSDIVDRLIAKKKIEWEEEERGRSKHPEAELFPGPRPFPTGYREYFQGFERMIQQNKLPLYPVAGPLSYTMSPEEIKERTAEAFQHLREQGIVITKEEFNRRYNPDEWLDRKTNLTRVWGALYLAYHFKEDNKLRGWNVPQYLIVVNDLNAIQVEITKGSCFPVLEGLNQGTIYAKKIYGTPEARPTFKSLSNLGYTDFSDPGNILQTADGALYVVDTEYKSFYDGQPQSKLFEKISNRDLLCEYLNDRFELLNPGVDFPLRLQFSIV